MKKTSFICIFIFIITLFTANVQANEKFTKGQFAVLINEAMNFVEESKESFSDIKEGDLYYVDMLRAKKAGYFSGDDSGNVYPDNTITKAEAAVVFTRALGWDTSGYEVHEKAYPENLKWAAKSIEAMKYLEIYTINTNLNAPLSEEEGALLVERLKIARELPLDNPYSVKQVDKKDDFFTYVNNGWLLNTKIASGEANISTFTQMEELTQSQIEGIIQDIVLNQKHYVKNSDEWKMAQIYKMYTDLDQRNELGITPLQPYIDGLIKATTPEELRIAMEKIASELGTSFLYSTYVASDEMDRRKNALYVGSPYLGLLNDPYYYLSKEEYPKLLREEYQQYLANLLVLTGLNEQEAEQKAIKVLEFEMKLANAQAKDVTTSNMKSFYNPVSSFELGAMTPNLQVEKWLYQSGFRNIDKVVVTNTEVLKFSDAYFKEENMEQIKYYVICSLISNFASLLSEEAYLRHLDFYNKLSGANGSKSLEAEAIALVGNFMPDAVSEKFVTRFFSKSAKEDVEEMVKKVIRRYRIRLERNEWLESETKREAIIKLENIGIKVGYPSRFKEYGFLQVRTYSEKGNLIEIYKSLIDDKKNMELQQYKEPSNLRKWDVPAYETNAYYDLNSNSIIIPAGILQNPIYSENMAIEEKLGGIGIIIGHEISHAFDTNGAQYDENGNIRKWWSREDYQKFQEKSNQVAEFFSEIEVIEGEKIDGYLTLSETVADLGGIRCALDILEEIPGSNADLFFTTQAKVFRLKANKENIIFSLSFDSHNPMVVRVNETLSMFDEFYKTYNIQPGDGMYLEEASRVSVW